MPQLIFEYIVDKPNSPPGELGDYQTYIDVSGTESINLKPPKDYAILGARLYRDTEDKPGRRIHHNTQKTNDQNTLWGYGRTDRSGWQRMFAGNPGFGGNTGISFTVNNDGTATIQDSNPAGQGPVQDRALNFLVARVVWPSPLRGSVGLGGFTPMPRIGPPRLEPTPS